LSQLPAADWFVAVEVAWTVPSGRYVSYRQGGSLLRQVKTIPDQTVEVILTVADFAGR
jgi:hypothetical protein